MSKSNLSADAQCFVPSKENKQNKFPLNNRSAESYKLVIANVTFITEAHEFDFYCVLATLDIQIIRGIGMTWLCVQAFMSTSHTLFPYLIIFTQMMVKSLSFIPCKRLIMVLNNVL